MKNVLSLSRIGELYQTLPPLHAIVLVERFI